MEAALYDALGRRVAVLTDGRFPTGRHALTLEAGRLPPGVYVVRVRAGTGVVSRPIRLTR